MKPPPFLTTRERELLPYLASGANRSQIALHFGLSEETVKRHTRNILSKFNAKTIRDGMWDITEYVTYFGDPDPMYSVYAHSVITNITFNSDLELMSCNHVHSFECVGPQFDRSVFSVLDGDFKAESVSIDGVVLNHLTYEFGKKTFETKYETAKLRGERFDRVTNVIFNTKNNTLKDSYCSTWVTYPAGKIDFSINFVGERQPQRIWYEIQMGGQIIQDTSVLWDLDGARGSMHISAPRTERVYLIRWRW